MADQQTTDIVQRLRAKRAFRIAEGSNLWTETDPDDAVRADAAAEIERLRARLTAVDEACRKYEEGGFGDPGRAMDDVRGALGRRDGA